MSPYNWYEMIVQQCAIMRNIFLFLLRIIAQFYHKHYEGERLRSAKPKVINKFGPHLYFAR